MTGKQKIYFLLHIIDNVRQLAPSGQPLIIDPTNDLNRNYRDVELQQLFTKFEKDEKILKVLQIPSRMQMIEIVDDPFDYQEPEPDHNDGCYHIELLPAFDDYFLKIQEEPEVQEFTGHTPTQKKILIHDLSVLYPEIFTKCHNLFETGAYAEAVEKSFKIVKDRLRDLTGHERGADAFGNGKLHIKGASAQNVDQDFNEAVKFLTMAIDNFRNEKSHTSDAKIESPQRAYEYLTLSSLAMNLLDQAEIITK